ncbi:hypothetical protein DdX_10633 [Ditylenchus destructor]|uniref:Uncharacterized protein n=1 Tax=Ditylenchus destructor TaxID=166010 RepID=A0AAD4N2E6_9BILA|nr:hypothetical protein DdX_10633 [Ditylenchus destructor]
MHNFDPAQNLDIEFEKAPITFAPDGYTAILSKDDVNADYVLLGKFTNNAIRKLFRILLYNCFFRHGSEMFKCYRIWSEDVNLACAKPGE